MAIAFPGAATRSIRRTTPTGRGSTTAIPTFWKSNPYLHGRPQWIAVDLGSAHPVDSIAIVWSEPHALDYEVQWWEGKDPIAEPDHGRWVAFSSGGVHDARGGTIRTSLEARPRTVRWIRVWMTRASGTALRPSDDPRDREGFAVAEISVGVNGRDWIRHSPSHTEQSVVWVSSTDPWHRAIDRDPSMEQPGLDRVLRSGLTRRLPMLTPVAILYGTPEDAAAEVRFLNRRGAGSGGIEMGEEPDGQQVSPEDYAALYVRWAAAIRAVDPSRAMGGPALQSTRDRVSYWPDGSGRTAWMGRFVDALREAGQLSAFGFFSFEWYPVDDVCRDPSLSLRRAPAMLREVLAGWRSEGVPTNIPWVASEYGWSSYAAREEVDMTAALFNTAFLADFLSLGGGAAYFYGLEPEVLIRESAKCPSYGNLLLFVADAKHRIIAPVAAYHAARLLTQRWLATAGMHELLEVRGAPDGVRAWAVRRPDQSLSLLLVNDSNRNSNVELSGMTMTQASQFSSREYAWKSAGAKGRPLRSKPPRAFHPGRTVQLPGPSITVIEVR
jgi:F5/8 type C domain.